MLAHSEKIVSALYSAKSENRETVLSDLLQNVLYDINAPCEFDEITFFLKEYYHLEPIEYELKNSLDELVKSNHVNFRQPHYNLSQGAAIHIRLTRAKTSDESEKRKKDFIKIIDDFVDINLKSHEKDLLWEVFNEYLLECFMNYGRKAIDIFLPNKEEYLAEDDNILRETKMKINNENLFTIFKRIILEYPNRLTESELRFLFNLASKAERFYSLGMEKSAYEELKGLNLSEIKIILDTNILYSVLDLHSHEENAAIQEIIRLVKEGVLSFKLFYLKKTYLELCLAKGYFNNAILKENFAPSYIRAMVSSNGLQPLVKHYYESKLKNSELKHPSDRLHYASDILRDKKIILLNPKFNGLDDEESNFINKKITEYTDYERFVNNWSETNDHEINLSKTEDKIEHDVYLREAIVQLKEKEENEHDLKLIGLTLDKTLINFDKYLDRKNRKKRIYPNFLFPSVFLKKIRPFIPIVTSNYRKAFVTSVTYPSYLTDDTTNSEKIQSAMKKFKDLGIDNEEIIRNCIRRDVFLDELSHREDSEEINEFILSEIGGEINKIQQEKKELLEKIESLKTETQKKIQEKEDYQAFLIGEKRKEQEKLQEDLSKLKIDYENELLNLDTVAKLDLKLIEQRKDDEIKKLNEKNLKKNNEIESLELQVKIVQEKLDLQVKQNRLKEKIEIWNNEFHEYLQEDWTNNVAQLSRNFRLSLFSLLLISLPLILGIFLKIEGSILKYLEINMNFKQAYIYLILLILQGVELYLRSYIIDKQRVKDGWSYIMILFKGKYFSKQKSEHKEQARISFEKAKPFPTLQDISI